LFVEDNTDEAGTVRDIRNEQMRVIFMQAPISNVVAILISILCFFVLKGHLGDLKMSIWVSSLTLLAFYRLWLWHKYKTNQDRYDTSGWLIRYTFSSALLGLVWGSIYLFANNLPLDPVVMGAIFMLYFGVIVAAFSILTIYLPVYFLYTLPASVTFPILLFNFGEQIFLLTAIAVIIFYLMLGFFAKNTNRNQIEMILLKIKNKSLVDKLTQEVHQRDSLVQEKTNQLQSLNQALYRSEDQLRNVINGANLGYWDWNYQSGHHEVNDRWLEILGLDPGDIKNDVSDWSDRIHPEDKERMMTLVEKHIDSNSGYAEDFRMKHKDGHWVWIQGSGSVVEFDEQTNKPLRLCGTHEDINSRKKMEQQLEYQATHDELTGLLNRVELWKNLDAEVSRAKRYNHDLSILLIDIDHFKTVNDKYGHKVGDEVLCKFTDTLLEHVRQTDYATRYGGEEFIVILPETPVKEAEELAERLRMRISETKILLKNTSLNITVSIGIATFPIHRQTSSELLDSADKAMYQAKNDGRNCIKIGSGKF